LPAGPWPASRGGCFGPDGRRVAVIR